MKVLVACEESQAVTKELRRLGHEAYSCDILECSGGHPEWHILGDCVPILNGRCSFETMDGTTHEITDRWDMIIGHPPCTYISNAGVRFLYPGGKGILNEERLKKGIEATHFFLRILYADCDRIAVENPIPTRVYCLPPYSQVIQPYMFGHPLQKKTCLWLKGLPDLVPTDVIPKEQCQSTKIAGNWFNKGGEGQAGKQSKNLPWYCKSHGRTVGRKM